MNSQGLILEGLQELKVNEAYIQNQNISWDDIFTQKDMKDIEDSVRKKLDKNATLNWSKLDVRYQDNIVVSYSRSLMLGNSWLIHIIITIAEISPYVAYGVRAKLLGKPKLYIMTDKDSSSHGTYVRYTNAVLAAKEKAEEIFNKKVK